MATVEPVVISAAVEGLVDEAVVRRLIQEVGGVAGPVYGKNGKPALRTKIAGYNHAANYSPWIVMVDLNHEASCVPSLRAAWLPTPAPQMCFRVAVRAVEAWLLADHERISRFISVDTNILRGDPELLPDPKQRMVELAKRSNSISIRRAMVPRPESGRSVGPAYASRLIEFVTDLKDGWRPNVAAKRSESLDRCLGCLRRLMTRRSP